jgi:hypothetical protein
MIVDMLKMAPVLDLTPEPSITEKRRVRTEINSDKYLPRT